MITIPDAPWIRNTEMNGLPDGGDVYCPICNEENPEYFYLQGGEIICCSECVERVDPFEWADNHPQVTENPFGEYDDAINPFGGEDE